MVVFQMTALTGKADGCGQANLVVLHIGTVASDAFSLPVLGHGDGAHVPGLGKLIEIVHDAVFVAEFRGLEFPADLIAEAEGHACVDHSLPLEHIGVVIRGDVDVGKDLEVRLPVEARAGLLAGRGLLFELADDAALFKVQIVPEAVAVDLGVEVFRGVLGGAGAEAVQTQAVFIVSAALIIFVLYPISKFPINKSVFNKN